KPQDAPGGSGGNRLENWPCLDSEMSPTLDLLHRCSWRAECLFKARGSFRIVLWLTLDAAGHRAQFETACTNAPPEASDAGVLEALAAEMGEDFRRDGVVRFAVAYPGRATVLNRQFRCAVIEAHSDTQHMRARREIIFSPARTPMLGALSAIESAHSSLYAKLLLECVTA